MFLPKTDSEVLVSYPGDPVPDATAWDAEFSRKHWVTRPDRFMPGCSIGNNPYWAIQVKLVRTLALCHTAASTHEGSMFK